MEGDDIEDWNPEKEKREDPAKLAREAIELQKEGIAYLKKLRGEDDGRRIGSFVTASTAPKPRRITLQVREIDNGFILARGPMGHEYVEQADETYYQTVPELLEGGKEGRGRGFFAFRTPIRRAGWHLERFLLCILLSSLQKIIKVSIKYILDMVGIDGILPV